MAGDKDDLDIMAGIPNDDTLDDDLESVDDALAREQAGDEDEDALGTIKFSDEEDEVKAETKKEEDDDEEGLDEIVFDDEGNDVAEVEDMEEDDAFEEEEKTKKSFQNRLGREQRLKTQAYKQSEELATANEYLVERLQKAEVGHLTVRREAAAMTRQMLGGYEEALNEQIRLGEEVGDESTIAKAKEALQRVQRGQMTADDMLANSPSDEQLERHVPQNLPEVQSRPRLNALAQDWVDNNSWFNDPKHAAKRAAVIELDNELANSGLDKGSAEYYKRLSIKVSQEFPALEVRSHDGRRVRRADAKAGGRKRGGSSAAAKRETTGSGRKAPVVTTRGRRNGKTIVMNSAEKGMMEALGLDFDNKDHVKEFRLNHKP